MLSLEDVVESTLDTTEFLSSSFCFDFFSFFFLRNMIEKVMIDKCQVVM